jgi:hypothetical protein
VNATQDECTREETPFRDVLPEVMAECGIKDLNELYSRYLEADGKWSKRRFMPHARPSISISLRSSSPLLRRRWGSRI